MPQKVRQLMPKQVGERLRYPHFEMWIYSMWQQRLYYLLFACVLIYSGKIQRWGKQFSCQKVKAFGRTIFIGSSSWPYGTTGTTRKEGSSVLLARVECPQFVLCAEIFTTPAAKKATLFYSVPSLKKEGSFRVLYSCWVPLNRFVCCDIYHPGCKKGYAFLQRPLLKKGGELPCFVLVFCARGFSWPIQGTGESSPELWREALAIILGAVWLE
jgi:hypothetical protein